MALEFHNALKAHAKSFPEKAAIIDGETTVSYAELLEKAEKFAGGLDSLNPGPKSKMAILSVNQNEFLIALLGSFIKGIPVVPINFLLGPDDLVHIVQEAEIDILLVDRFFVVPGSEKFFSLFPHKITVGEIEDPKLIGEGSQKFEDFIANGNREAGCKRHKREAGIPDVILYTSGTTAKPKGVMLDESQFYANTTGILANAPFSEEDKAIMALPLFHSFGNIIALVFIRIGGSIILIRQFAPKAILANITDHKATILPLVPTIYSFLLDVYARGGIRCIDFEILRIRWRGSSNCPSAYG